MRLFFAVWPQPAQRTALTHLAHKLARLSRARVNGADALHLTLAFLGEVDEARLPELYALGASLAERTVPGELALTHSGSWDNGIVWAAPDETPPALLALVAQLNSGLSSLALPVDKRRYKPHLTLGRRAHAPLAKRALPQPIRLAFDHIALVASESHSAGSRYTNLRCWPLLGTTPPGVDLEPAAPA